MKIIICGPTKVVPLPKGENVNANFDTTAVLPFVVKKLSEVKRAR